MLNLCLIQLIEFIKFYFSCLSRDFSSTSVYDDLDILENDIHSDSHFTKAGSVIFSVTCVELLSSKVCLASVEIVDLSEFSVFVYGSQIMGLNHNLNQYWDVT